MPHALPQSEVWTQEELERISVEIRGDIEELRGLKFKRPVQVHLASKQDFLEYARERLDRMESPESLAADEMVAKLLGLIPPDMDLMGVTLEVLQDQVGGFYDPATESFYLMETFTGGVAKVILAHELTHALDDQWHDIDGTLEELGGSTDRELAYHSVVEGSGTAIMNQWTLGNLSELSLADLMKASTMGTESLSETPAYIWKPFMAIYLRGESFLRRSASVVNLLGKKSKPADIEAAFLEPPRSTEQILHPEKYWKKSERDEPRVIELELSGLSALGGGWEVLATDTLGELFLALLTAPEEDRGGLELGNPMALLAMKYTNEAAEGWGGDRIVILKRAGAYILYAVTLWDTAQDADEFASCLTGQAETVAGKLAELRAIVGGEEAGYGFRTMRGERADEVRLVSFVGVYSDEVDRVLSAIKHREVHLVGDSPATDSEQDR